MVKFHSLGLLLIIGLCAAAPQQTEDNLEDLINKVFNKQPTTVKPADNFNDGSLDSLIDSVFNNQNNNTNNNINNGNKPTDNTYLGVNNNPPVDNDDCRCVPYYQCMNGSILDDGIGLIDIRIRTCEDLLDVCCKIPQILDDKDRVTPRPTVRRGCGQRKPDGVGFRITGQTDNEAQFAEFPWMVAVLREKPVGNSGEKMNFYQCGGSLIHPQAVLTSAHCVNASTPSQYKIRAGEWDTQTKREPFPHQDRDVQRVITHPAFHPASLRNDYAILILSQPVTLAENVDVICLAERGETFDNANCLASGWGKDKFGKEGNYQVILKRVELRGVNHQQCQDALRQTRLGSYFILHNSFMCAGGQPGVDTCKGDGGSPLVCPLKRDPTRYTQAGIVAWGIGCGDNGIPGVYANIAQGRDWIEEQLFQNNLNFDADIRGGSSL